MSDVNTNGTRSRWEAGGGGGGSQVGLYLNWNDRHRFAGNLVGDLDCGARKRRWPIDYVGDVKAKIFKLNLKIKINNNVSIGL